MAFKRDTLQRANSAIVLLLDWTYLQHIFCNNCFLRLADLQKIPASTCFHSYFILSFPRALSLTYSHIHLSTGSDRLKRHRLFLSVRELMWGVQRQSPGSSDASGSLAREPGHIPECRTLESETEVTGYRWGRDRAQWLVGVFLPLSSGKQWITPKEIS